MTFLFAIEFVGNTFGLMLFKKTRNLLDLELGRLEARTSILQSSLIKWQKSIEFLGDNVVIEVYGTKMKVNQEEQTIMVEAFKRKELLEKQVLKVIKGFCRKHGLNLDAWGDYFKCIRIYSDNQNLYVSIIEKWNKLTYEIEVKGFNRADNLLDIPLF